MRLAPKHLTCDAQNRHPKFFLEWNAECLNKETYGGQIVTEQKNVSLLSTIMWPVEESTNLDELLFPWEFPFLDLRSEGLSNLVTLSEPRFARSDNRSTLLDIIPSSLRSRKEKSNRGKKSSSLFVFLYRPYYVTRKEDIFPSHLT